MSVKDMPKSSAFTIPTTTICYPHQRTEEGGSDVLRPPAKISLLSPVLGQTRRRRAATSAKQKEPAVVARRNARERKRVKLVNDGFMRLRKHVPTDPKNKKLSKVKTLRSAIDYIRHLQHVLAMANKHQMETEHEAAGTQTQSWITASDFVSTTITHLQSFKSRSILIIFVQPLTSPCFLFCFRKLKRSTKTNLARRFSPVVSQECGRHPMFPHHSDGEALKL
ncbi:unnamed protein product [Pocillopora meandrina]|uniref:BHLH domain-containing protein n=1 Tax=Pocillopora meandrina TaxID=46732 RepID=A0AAU9Y0Y6_9CNID|nr:unnamed protein product [Pocillopora meandrina]